MTELTARFDDLSHHCRVAQDLVDDVHRWLGDLADLVSPSIDLVAHSRHWHLQLFADRTEGSLRDSDWHKVVMRLNEFFGPPIVTRRHSTLVATFDTPFGFTVAVACIHEPVKVPAAEMTLEQVLADDTPEMVAS